MALNRSGLQSDIYDAFQSMINSELPEDARQDAEATMEELSRKLANAINSFVKTGTVSTSVKGVTSGGTTVEGTGSGTIS